MPTIAQRREIIVRQQAERKARAKKARTETAEQNAERQKIAESWAAAEKRADRVWRGLPPTEAESTTRAKQIAAKYNGRDGAEPDKKQTETEKEIERLARLSGLYYERERQGIAAKMGVRVHVLDSIVKARCKEISKAEEKPATWTVEPASNAINGDELLDAIKQIFERYVVLPPHAADAITLWIMHTWAIDAADISAILALISPEKRCGKTTVLKIINRLARRASLASNISTAALFRYVEAEQPTLLIDEADTFLKDNEEMRGVLNSGHSREAAFVIRCEGEDMTPRRFSTWAAKAIACIKKLPPTLTDRSITVPMRRKLKSEKRPRYRDRDTDEYQRIRSQALRWASDNKKALAAEPPVPDALDDRAADNWRPLLAIAHAAGGEWPKIARTAALSLSGAADDTLGVRLLRDIKWTFEGKPKESEEGTFIESDATEQMPSKELVGHLIDIEDSPWADWPGKGLTPTVLAELLEPYDIRPRNIRVGEKVARGYEAAWFEEAFAAYLHDVNGPAGGNLGATPLQQNKIKHIKENLATTVKDDVTVEKSQKPPSNGHCSGVAGKPPPPEGEALVGRPNASETAPLTSVGYLDVHDFSESLSDAGVVVANGYAITSSPENREPGPTARVWIREICHPAIKSGPDDDLADFAAL